VRTLVLGGNRYIGLNLVHELARQGHEVTVANSHEVPLPDGVRRLHGDRRVPGVLADLLGPHHDDFDVVFDNTAYQPEDLEPLVTLFRGRVRQFVFTSSVAVYRRSYIQPVHESFRVHDTADTHPAKAYGIGKIKCERYLDGLFDAEGFPATSLRVGHTIGPRSPLVTREPMLFARLEQGRPILVPGDGFPFLHFVHVADVARLMVSLIGNEACAGKIYNVLGREIASIDGCIKLMADAAGVEAEIVHVPLAVARGLRDPLLHWNEALVGGTIYSIDKALADLDWEPQFGLADGYRDSYEWFAHEGRDRYEYDFSLDDEVLASLTNG
jgi:nucleoside-diphosphate-sugar epimerase